jgi:hypothetical protein
MPSSVKLPLVGNVPKPALIIGGVGGVGVIGYILWKHKMNAGTATADGSAATGYGSSESGFYGYGSEFAYGGAYGGGIQPYPIGSQYGYGAFGYGYYNPYTGQYLGGSTSTPPGPTPTPTPTPTPKPTPSPTGSHTVTANGKLDLWYFAKLHGIGEKKLLSLNPNLKHLEGSSKPIPKGTRVKV